jgi:citrate synthase
MAEETLAVVDNRTGAKYTLPIHDGTIRAADLRQIKTDPDDFGLMSYDPAFVNTAACYSKITFIDGERGILRYRGYPIEVLAEHCTYLEVAYLLLFGELPNQAQLKEWIGQVAAHKRVPDTVRSLMDGFPGSTHPMGVLVSLVAAMSTSYPEAKNVRNAEMRKQQVPRLIGKMPTLAALSYRHSLGINYVDPDDSLGYTENFMSMMWKKGEQKYLANPTLSRALDVLFILHADHEQNCSTNTMRGVGSAETDPYLTLAAATAALAGPLHGGANEAVVIMLDKIGSKDRVPAFIKEIKAGHGKLMGFGHRVYKNYDPRARIIKRTAELVFEVTGKNPKLEIALELERIALEDDYFGKRKLYPNVDFYSGIIYQAMGFDPAMFTVMFAIARTTGWLAQWQEMMEDPEQKIARPRQIYSGHVLREFVPIEARKALSVAKG